MKRERWRTVFFLVILLIFTLVVRFFSLRANSGFIAVEGEYYQKAIVDNQGIYSIQTLSLDEIYTKALSIAMLFLGNYEVVGAYLNILLQVLAIVFLYFAINMVANSYVSCGVAMVISLIPFYSDKVYEISSFNLLMLLYAGGLFILAMLCKGVYMFAIKKTVLY